MTIDTARERDGLYYLEKGVVICGFQVDRKIDKERIMLWHCCLGHPSFPYLEHLFSKFYYNISTSSLICEQCIFVKDRRISLKISTNKGFVPFACVYTDLSGPFSTPIAYGHKYLVFLLMIVLELLGVIS